MTASDEYEWFFPGDAAEEGQETGVQPELGVARLSAPHGRAEG